MKPHATSVAGPLVVRFFTICGRCWPHREQLLFESTNGSPVTKCRSLLVSLAMATYGLPAELLLHYQQNACELMARRANVGARDPCGVYTYCLRCSTSNPGTGQLVMLVGCERSTE
jgi:hypothetical protein